MHGLPKNFDSRFLIGRSLEMVCFTANQVYLHFDDQIAITIEGSFEYEPSTSSGKSRITELPITKSDLMQLLEKKIVDVSWNEQGTISMTFDNGHVFKCLDTFPNYESYQIKHGKKTIVV